MSPPEEPANHWIDERLEAERPEPSPAFRGQLYRHVLARERGGFARPRHLGMLIPAYASCGAFLLALAIAGVLGAGPFAA